MTSTVQSAISTKGLARSFGRVEAVAGLDLEVHRGEMFGLVGPDSAGKSTAIRLLCGILNPTGGAGKVLGFDLGTEAEKIKSRIGYLSQAFTLYGDLTIDENIEFFAEIHGVKGYQKRRDELLDFTRLTPFRKRLAQAMPVPYALVVPPAKDLRAWVARGATRDAFDTLLRHAHWRAP